MTLVQTQKGTTGVSPTRTEKAKSKMNNKFAEKAELLKPQLHETLEYPISIIEFKPDPNAFFKCNAVEKNPIMDLPNLSYGKDDQVILDFGSHHVGYLSFHIGVDGVDVDAPTRLRLTFGEIPYDVTESLHPCNTGISTSWLPDEIINIDWLPTDVKMPRRYAFRYLKIEVLDTSRRYKVQFSNVYVRGVSAVSPTQVVTLGSTDKELIAIDRISQLTLRNCMQTVFEDGPRRDRRLWLGDLRLQALTNYCTFKDFNLAKRCLYLFAALSRLDGSLPACVFEKPKISAASDYIVDYDALFGPTLYDYTMASGDLETAEELWSTVLGSMKMSLSHLDEEGNFDSNATDAWKFLDWSDGLDTNAGMHGLVLYCCKENNKLAELIGKTSPFLEVVKKMTEAAYKFYDPSQRVFVSGPDRQISWISQAWMALSGCMDSKTCLEAITTAMADVNALKPLTPYAYHHVAEALAKRGGEEDCLKLIREYWGGMARAGADTFWECFDENDSRRSPYGDCHNNSYCHAWSCTPSYLLRMVVKELGNITTNA